MGQNYSKQITAQQKDMDALHNFYFREDISNTVPNRKHRKKRFLKMTSAEAYEKYRVERRAAGARVLGFTMFHQHRPKNIKLLIQLPDMGCSCNSCVNCSLKIRSLRSNGLSGSLSSRLTVNVVQTLCSVSEQAGEYHDEYISSGDILEYKLRCIHRTCPFCGILQFREKLFEENQELFAENKEVHYMTWERVQMEGSERKKICRLKKTERIVNLLDMLLEDLKNMSRHLFNYRFQHQEFERCKQNLTSGDILIVCDFATNFTHTAHEEPQNAHWSRPQTTVHPTVCYFPCKECNHHIVSDEVFIASDDLTHDFHAVAAFEAKVEDHLRNTGVEVNRIFRFSDNCANQYKSRHVADWISRKKYPYQSNYFCSQHGKGPSDGVAGRCTQLLAQAKKKGTALDVEDAASMIDFFQREVHSVGGPENDGMCVHKRRHFYVVNDIRRDMTTESAMTIKGTQKIHCIRNTGVPGVVEVRQNSCFCAHCTHGNEMQCDQTSHVHKFLRANIYGKDQPKMDFRTCVNTLWGDHSVDFTKTWSVNTASKAKARKENISTPCSRRNISTRENATDSSPVLHLPVQAHCSSLPSPVNVLASPVNDFHVVDQDASLVFDLPEAHCSSLPSPVNVLASPVIDFYVADQNASPRNISTRENATDSSPVLDLPEAHCPSLPSPVNVFASPVNDFHVVDQNATALDQSLCIAECPRTSISEPSTSQTNDISCHQPNATSETEDAEGSTRLDDHRGRRKHGVPRNYEQRVDLAEIGTRTQPLRSVALERKICRPCSVIMHRLTSEDLSKYLSHSNEFMKSPSSENVWSEDDLQPLSHCVRRFEWNESRTTSQQDWSEEDNLPLSHFVTSIGKESDPREREHAPHTFTGSKLSIGKEAAHPRKTDSDVFDVSEESTLESSLGIESQDLNISGIEINQVTPTQQAAITYKIVESQIDTHDELAQDSDDSDEDECLGYGVCARTLPCQKGCARSRPFVRTIDNVFTLPQVDGPSDCIGQRKLRSSSKKEAKPVAVAIKLSGCKGLGLFAAQDIEKNTVVCEYEGRLIGEHQIPHSSSHFPPNIEDWTTGSGNYAFFFKTLDGRVWCIDAENTISYGARINHSRTHFNLVPFVCEKERGHPRLFFKAARFISNNEELLYDYGEREEETVNEHPWLRV